MEAPRAFRRELFDLVGGWDETLTAAEDWDLADRTRAAGVGIARISSWIWHDEGEISLRAQFTKKQYYGRWVAEYMSRKPEARRHLSRPGLLAQAPTMLRSPVRTAGMVVLKGVETAGLVCSACARAAPRVPGLVPSGRGMTRIVHVIAEFSAKEAMGRTIAETAARVPGEHSLVAARVHDGAELFAEVVEIGGAMETFPMGRSDAARATPCCACAPTSCTCTAARSPRCSPPDRRSASTPTS